MPSRRDQIKMSPEEIATFLDEERTITVASINPDGTPHLTAMWFTHVDGVIRFWTFAKSQKAMNLRRDPRATILCEAGEVYEELRGVSITGSVDLTEDTESLMAFGTTLYERYWGATGSAADTRQAVEKMGAKRVLITLTPEKVATWDHRKLGGRY